MATKTNTKTHETHYGYLMDCPKHKEKSPDLRGTCTIDGTEFSAAAWHKSDHSGKAYISFSLSRKIG